MKVNQRRIKRDYRQYKVLKFLSFVLEVKRCMTDNANYTESTWGGSALLQQFFNQVVKLEAAYHAAINGDRLLIQARDKLIEEVIETLDEIALLLEAASARNPNALLSTGFSISQERRSSKRVKPTLVSPLDFNVVNSAELGKAVGSASNIVGALIQEIQINRKDPTVEQDWFHKALFPDAKNMLMENLEAGNTFFRMRCHGPDGPGPWSPTTSTPIT